MTKSCRMCGISREKAAADGVKFVLKQNICRVCYRINATKWKESQRVWRDENRDYLRKYGTEYRKKNIAKIRAHETSPTVRKRKQQREMETPENFIGVLVSHIKTRTKSRRRKTSKAIVSTITKKMIVDLFRRQGGRCAITKTKMTHTRNCPQSISVDRIVPKLGYAQDNVQLVCKWVNYAKHTLTNQQIIDLLIEAAQSITKSRRSSQP